MHTPRTWYRAAFLSDLHIGAGGFRADACLALLKSIECDDLYLVGDIFDLLAMHHGIEWNDDVSAVIRRLLKMARDGTMIHYLTGNHDEALRQLTPLSLGDRIELVDETVHTTKLGQRLMVIHGDKFDFVVGHMRWLTHIGAHLYDWLLKANGALHTVRTWLGFRRYWSLSACLKSKAKQAVSFVRDFEAAACRYARDNDCTGVICGHIHTPKLAVNTELGVLYANCGDLVESLSYLAETEDGTLQLIYCG